MNRPSFAAYLLGNPLSVLAITGVTATLGYKAAQGEVMFVPMLLMALLTLRSWHCASRLVAYRRWQREWNAMSGGGNSGMHRGSPSSAPLAPRSGAMIGGGNDRSGHEMNRGGKSNDSAGGGAPIFARAPWLKPILGLVLWGVVIALAQPMLHSGDNPLSASSGDTLFPTCFWLGNLIVGGVVLVRAIRAARRRFNSSDKALDVTVCLRPPLHSPDYRHTFAQLPDHCRKVIER